MEISVVQLVPLTVMMVNVIQLQVTVNVPVLLTDIEDPDVISYVLITVVLEDVTRTRNGIIKKVNTTSNVEIVHQAIGDGSVTRDVPNIAV